jgi:hypothetical protein
MGNIVMMATMACAMETGPEFTPSDWLEIASSPALDSWIQDLRQAETSTRKLRLRLEASREPSTPLCAYCGEPFFARSGAKYCSPSHRAMGNRRKVLR